ncbi:DUF721 domain-containing protein [Cyanobium sp. HWJ4-Hawea]|uniref:DUF721 domain-containing protein n=1 Tax=Cyanobium sp. HWJ4-Hawea TaxID=2823713 RepID=UPI0020CCC32F|nr:DUF721 domain-containing protein [Cyanobium sp. HWJ4-Hawea]MCP9807856.1 DUF721 domain-containing protein [Cyanobium sp. HWJ4-Hawea]
MAKAPREQTRQVGNLSYLMAPPRAPASGLANCLESLQKRWQQADHLGALWKAWPAIAGPQLAPHCRPLRLQGGLLTVGAGPGPWLQALQYNRHQLLGSLRAKGFSVRDLRFEQHHSQGPGTPGGEEEAQVWAQHPSRVDVHGMGSCPQCGSPAPAGEMALWGHCSFCRRSHLQETADLPGHG